MHWDIGVMKTIVADSVMLDHDNKKYISWKPLLAESSNMFSGLVSMILSDSVTWAVLQKSVVSGLVADEYSSSKFSRHTFSSSISFLNINQYIPILN